MEGIAIGAAANLSSEASKGIFQDIKRHVRYVFIHKKLVEKFEEKKESLIAKRVSVQQKVDTAEMNLETIHEDVNHWCQRVDNTIDEKGKKVKDLEDQAKAKCFIGLCPNIKSRYQLSRKAEEYVAVVDELLQQGQFDEIGFRGIVESPISAPPKNLMDYDSRNVVFDKIMAALNDSTISMIGVYGPGGVGKTTLVNKVARHVKEIGLFCPVIDVTVTLDPNIKNIQERIAVSLGLELKEEDIKLRAYRLSKRLEEEEKKKKILIVLDDIWEQSELKEVGIPFGDQYNGCKILLTSRDRNVLTKKLDVKDPFPIGVLDKKEAWDLFQKMAENDFEDPELKSVATEVARKCGGLPLAIVTIARALRKADLGVWKNALLLLQRPSPENFTEISPELYSSIQLSYNYLKSDALKRTFLLSCLLGNNAEDLLRCAMGLRLFAGVKTVEETRNRVLAMVSYLKASCLLLDDCKDDRLVMHDLVWDVASAIASTDINAYVLRHVAVFEDWEGLEKREMISLSSASITNLPDELECPQLTLFSMGSSSWDSDLQIPPSFFEKMEKIEVLNLIKADFSSSASLISLPTSLRTLCLKRCRLGDMVSLGKLKNLEILDLSSSDIKMLPVEIGQLTKLRSLDLTHCGKLRIIPPDVLSSLSRLEELCMDGVSVRWNQQGNAHLDELKGLSSLTTLHIRILDAEIVPKDLFSEKLQRYKIQTGTLWDRWGQYSRRLNLMLNASIDHFKGKYSRTLVLKVNTSIDQLDDGVKGLVKKTEALKLGGSISVLEDELPLFGKEIELPRLEDLLLSKINFVGGIWHNQFSTLENLTNLEIKDCDNLIYILSSSTAKSLVKLKSFEISGCRLLREIIFSEDIEEDANVTILFPQLSTLRMESLEHFIGFCSESYNIAFPSLKTLEIEDCTQLNGFIYKSTTEDGTPLSIQAVFDEKIELPRLEDLRLSNSNVVRGMWHNQFSTLENLTNLEITNCDNLKYILSSSTAQSLMKLKSFKISRCHNLTEIIFSEKIEEAANVTISFPRLSTLRMVYLKHFIGFCSESYNIAFPSLKTLEIEDCPRLNGFIYKSTTEDGTPLSMQAIFDEKVTFPQLEELTLEGLKNCEKIWHNQLIGDLFLKNLVSFKVRNCNSLEEILKPQILDANGLHAVTTTLPTGEETPTNFVFPKLTFLEFSGLPKLKSFYSKVHTTKWPSLREMRLCGCDMVEIIFASESLCFQESTSQQPLFWVNEVTFPNLEVLKLKLILGKIWHGQLRADVFSKLRVLELEGFPDTSPDFPNCFSQSLPNLEKLVVKDAAFTGIEIDALALTSLNELSLVRLPQLTRLWKGEYNLSPVFYKLRSLGVWDCGKLKNLVPSSMSFENLTTLQIFGCHGFVNLIAYSTAKSLVQLKRMSIIDCDMLEEIIASEGDEVKGGIVFTRLEYLELDGLLSLASFCSGKHGFEFPALKNVRVIGCIEMKIFSQGDLSTPMLQRVQFDTSEGCWEGSLNTTIQWMFAEKVGCHEIKELVLSDSSKWMKIWRNPQKILNFKSVRTLKVHDCNTLRCLFTLSIALDLPQLWVIEVKNCTMMEHIIVDEGSDKEVENKIVFPRLCSITLESCVDLASFYHGSKILKCPSLEVLEVKNCPKMFAFASTFSTEQRTETIDDGGNTSRLSTDIVFFNNMVEFPLLWTLKIERLGNCKKIWQDHLIDDSFSKLNYLEVRNCDKLLNVFPFNMSERLKNLNWFRVRKCDSLVEIFESQAPNADELYAATATESIVFTNLEYFQLSCLPNLASFCLGKHNFEFPALEEVTVSECPKMKNFCQGNLSTPQLQKVILAADEDEDEDEKKWRWEGDLNTTIQRLYEEMNVQNPEED